MATVAGLSPTYGPTSGNTGVIVSGGGFTGTTAVTFGGVAAQGFFVNSDSQIEAYSPPEAAGVVDVIVTAPSGVSGANAADQFTYQAPVVTAVSPTSGSSVGGNTMEIVAKGSHVVITLNGATVVDDRLDAHPELAAEHTGLKRTEGLIGLQSHNGRVEFRNIRVMDLKKGSA